MRTIHAEDVRLNPKVRSYAMMGIGLFLLPADRGLSRAAGQ